MKAIYIYIYFFFLVCSLFAAQWCFCALTRVEEIKVGFISQAHVKASKLDSDSESLEYACTCACQAFS